MPVRSYYWYYWCFFSFLLSYSFTEIVSFIFVAAHLNTYNIMTISVYFLHTELLCLPPRGMCVGWREHHGWDCATRASRTGQPWNFEEWEVSWPETNDPCTQVYRYFNELTHTHPHEISALLPSHACQHVFLVLATHYQTSSACHITLKIIKYKATVNF